MNKSSFQRTRSGEGVLVTKILVGVGGGVPLDHENLTLFQRKMLKRDKEMIVKRYPIPDYVLVYVPDYVLNSFIQ